MAKKRFQKRNRTKNIAHERMDLLVRAAKDATTTDGKGELARRYVHVIRKIAMRIREPLDWKIRRQVCRACNTFLIPGNNARIRVSGKAKNAHVVVTCLHCGNMTRYHIRRREKNRPFTEGGSPS